MNATFKNRSFQPLSRNTFALACTFVLLFISQVFANESKQPNIVLFFVDDFGQRDLSCYGSTLYETPNMDRLAAEGMRFTRAYASYPRCVPSRQGLLSGKYPNRLESEMIASGNHDHHLPLSEVSFGEALGEAGYETCYIGKWHLGHEGGGPGAQGFQRVIHSGSAGATGSYFAPFEVEKGHSVLNPVDGKDGDYLTDRLTDEAVKYIGEERTAPFLMVMAHYAVHTPIQSPPPLVKKYKQKFQTKFSEPAKTIRDPRGAMSRPRLDDPKYAAMVENLDSNIERLLSALKKSEATKNTIVVFTSDNGGLSTLPKRVGPTSCRPFRAGKGWVYEGGIRIPTIISWPGNLEHREAAVPAISMDLYPTLLDLANLKLKPKQHVDGVSLVKTLRGEEQQPNRTMAWHYPHRHGSGHRPASAIRDGKWKLIHHWETNEHELFDLNDDVSEETNRIADQEKIAERLKRELSEWVKETSSK